MSVANDRRDERGFAAAAIYAVSVLLAKPIGRKSARYSNAIRESEKRLTGIFFDLTDRFALLKAFGRVDDRIRAFAQENDTFNESTVRAKISLNFYKTLTRVINSVAPVFIVCISIPSFATGEVSAGQLVTAVSLVSTLCVPIQNFGDVYLSIKKTWFKIREIDGLLREADEPQTEEGENRLQGDITFQNVGCKINGVQILSDVSFTIPYQKKTAIVGKTGSGKSTAMRILSGLLSGTPGSRMSVGGEEITELNRNALRGSVSSIPSTTYFVHDTLRANLELGDVEHDALEQVIGRLAIDRMAESLPDGFDTVIGSAGVPLSGGQQKLVGLARGLSVDRNYFLLDEVTTGLDDEAAERVMDELLARNGTLVLITHDIKYLDRMDHIILFDGGRVRASGTYAEVSDVWEELHEA